MAWLSDGRRQSAAGRRASAFPAENDAELLRESGKWRFLSARAAAGEQAVEAPEN